ncbi:MULTISPECIES: glycosyltransferase family 4 protein [unclassified Meiothermus]|uniref:glycosyltransferase family 4 protein n=1 Tax=unclassified Meiothermus TaxID=370471 RepID=UPI000D7C7CBF|nr:MULTISPECIES: glycosyltransferase family 4 protein [unclassified Meiothermus]PZA06816.1 hypothetical protein DNA98_11415 [Meiothermus sp. Pnk-1]RYM33097.1 glycosyltransferase [Meiothermus sp. PNK-Is4]
MKVVFFTPRPFSLAFGGTEVQLLETKAALEAFGIHVEFADYFSRDQLAGRTIAHLFGSDYVLAQITKLLTGKKVPYVTSSIFYPTGTSRMAHYCLGFLPLSVSSLRKAVLSGARYVLPNSYSESRLLQKLFGLPERSIKVVPNGVRDDFIGQDPDGFRRKYLPELTSNDRFVLSVGRIERRKNSLNLLRAAARIKIPLVFIGEPVALSKEKAYVQRFQEELERYPDYIKHIPFLSNGSNDLADAYAAAHAHALISWMETPGLANLEAGINGANLIVGESPPVREYLDRYATFVNQGDLNQISQAIERALTQSRNIYNQSAYISKNYSWKRVAQLMIDVYKEVLE